MTDQQLAEITRLRADLTEMTRLHSNALAALYRDDVETDPHLPDLFADGLNGLYEWEDQPEPDQAPQELVDRCVRIVKPAFGKLTQERDSLRAELKQVRAEPVRPSPDHSAVYLDEDGHLWSDYPTMPPGGDVLPMVWASERAQSRAELAERGNTLRVIGWCNP